MLATAAGHPGLAGLVHATLGVGSALAGIATAFIPERIGPERRILVAAGALLVLSLPAAARRRPAGLIAAVALLGCAVAPFMIGVFTLAERVVAPARVATAMTVLASATGLGYALGSTVAGRLADHHGYTAAFAVTVSAMGLAVVLVALSQRRLRLGPRRGALSGRGAQPSVDARATSSGVKSTCRWVCSGLVASSSTSSAAVRPSSWRGWRTEVSGTAAAAANSMSS